MSLTGWSKGWQRGWGSWTGRAARCCAWVLRPGSSFPTRKTLLWDPQTNWSFFSCPGLAPVTGSPSLDSRHGPVTGAASLLGDLAISGALASTELLEYRLLDEVNRFVLSCLAMALIGGPFPNIVLHPPEQFILQIIVNLKKSDFSSLSPPAELTIVQLHHRSAAWVSSELAALQILCYLALVLSPGPFPELRVQPLISGKRTGSAPRSEEGAREKALVKLPVPKIEGPAPQFWEKAPPLKNGQFRGQKHLENVPTFFYSFITYTKFTFCKKFGPNRPIQTSAVVRIFYCRLYGVPTTN